jgi:alpha-D-xyloside xylohydrolase
MARAGTISWRSRWEQHHETLQIEPWGRDSLRVRSTVDTGIRDDLLNILLPPAATDVEITIGEEGAVIRNGAITASISPEGLIRFSTTDTGAELLAEQPPVRATRLPPRAYKAAHGELFHLEARFRAYDDERLYGLGQHQHGRLDQKGCTIELIQRNTEVSIPFLLSSRGYGF